MAKVEENTSCGADRAFYMVTDGTSYCGPFHKGYIAQVGFDPKYDSFERREDAEACLAVMAKYYPGGLMKVVKSSDFKNTNRRRSA